MAYDPTAYARKKAEAKEKADKLKNDRDSRKGELEAQAAERKAALDALKTNTKPPPPSASSTPASSAIAAPTARTPAPAPSRSTSSNSSGGDSELMSRIQTLEREVQTLKDRDQARQQEYDGLFQLVSKLESEIKNRSFADEKSSSSSRTAPTASAPVKEPSSPSLSKPAPKEAPPSTPSLLKPASSTSAASPKPSFEPSPAKPKTPAPAPPPAAAEPSTSKFGSPLAKPVSPRPEAKLPPPAAAEEDDGEPAVEDLDELPVGGGGGGPSEFPEEAGNSGPLMTCSGCDRNFNAKAMKTHAKICKKVFQTKRKAFKVELIDPEQMDDFRPPKKQPEKKKDDDKDKVPKWKQQTDQLRAALKAGRDMQKALADGVALKDIPVAAVPAQADDRVTCPHCGRKFAENTAERHIPACKTSKAIKKK